jgi:hypothetical protein
MSVSTFQLRRPSLLQSLKSSEDIEQLPLSPLNTQELVGATWHMIASSSSMWQDRKRSITTTYSFSADGVGTAKLEDIAAWQTYNSTKHSATKGISYPTTSGSGFVFDWRGTGWLRFITTRWEIVGLGVLTCPPHIDGANHRQMGDESIGDGIKMLVTFVQKTVFSPQALSVFIQGGRLEDAQEQYLVKKAAEALRSLGVETIFTETDKIQRIPRK